MVNRFIQKNAQLKCGKAIELIPYDRRKRSIKREVALRGPDIVLDTKIF